LWQLGEAGDLPVEVSEVELFVDGGDERLLVELYLRSQPGDRNLLLDFACKVADRLPETHGVVASVLKRSKPGVGLEPSELMWGTKDLTYQIAHYTYVVPAGAFFQINRYLLPEVVELVTKNQPGKAALDLYSGVGLFAVPLARRFQRVVAVEPSAVSVAGLRANVPGNVKVSAQSTEQYLTSVGGKLKADLIVVDPPRAGLGVRVCAQLNEVQAQRMTYLSCDPATLARDLQQLLAGGWRISEMHLLDLFPQTFHIETCVMLQR
jgi:23S rRNA (uracil1939-C5)-methyltransferase